MAGRGVVSRNQAGSKCCRAQKRREEQVKESSTAKQACLSGRRVTLGLGKVGPRTDAAEMQ